MIELNVRKILLCRFLNNGLQSDLFKCILQIWCILDFHVPFKTWKSDPCRCLLSCCRAVRFQLSGDLLINPTNVTRRCENRSRASCIITKILQSETYAKRVILVIFNFAVTITALLITILLKIGTLTVTSVIWGFLYDALFFENLSSMIHTFINTSIYHFFRCSTINFLP